jgi:hypothetical protein
MNFIVKLSKFKNSNTEVEYDSILSIMKRLIKYVYFISFKEATSASELTHIIIRTVIVNHELSKE